MIPAHAHFIWFGQRLPWANVLAMLSASLQGGFEAVTLHCDHDHSGSPWWPQLEALPGFTARRIDTDALFETTGTPGAALKKIFAQLSQPAARANMVRAAILAAEGGVYLDTDTVTLRDMTELRKRTDAFCGLERIVLPYQIKDSRDPRVLAVAGLRMAAREFCRRLPDGWRLFRHLEPFYPAAANNAIVGCTPRHPLAMALLDGMIQTPPERRLVRFALGTHLLQRTLELPDIAAKVEMCPPRVFYPIGPEVSEHWFRRTQEPALAEALYPDTLVVHWYASVRTKEIVPRLSPSYVEEHQHQQLFSALAAQVLEAQQS